jgi:hypothetical protein
MKTTTRMKNRAAEKHGGPLSDRETCISVGAYYLAEGRGFAAGRELNDWLDAELVEDARKPEF